MRTTVHGLAGAFCGIKMIWKRCPRLHLVRAKRASDGAFWTMLSCLSNIKPMLHDVAELWFTLNFRSAKQSFTAATAEETANNDPN